MRVHWHRVHEDNDADEVPHHLSVAVRIDYNLSEAPRTPPFQTFFIHPFPRLTIFSLCALSGLLNTHDARAIPFELEKNWCSVLAFRSVRLCTRRENACGCDYDIARRRRLLERRVWREGHRFIRNGTQSRILCFVNFSVSAKMMMTQQVSSFVSTSLSFWSLNACQKVFVPILTDFIGKSWPCPRAAGHDHALHLSTG